MILFVRTPEIEDPLEVCVAGQDVDTLDVANQDEAEINILNTDKDTTAKVQSQLEQVTLYF